MALRLSPLLLLLFFLLATATSKAATLLDPLHFPRLAGDECKDGKIGSCVDEDDEMAADSVSHRRGLAPTFNYISYRALMKDRTPCNRRGYSYYNCNGAGTQRANPYRRACTVITQCYRFLN